MIVLVPVGLTPPSGNVLIMYSGPEAQSRVTATVQASFATKLKGDFEALSLAIANLPVGLIPFPDKAKAALQKLNTDVVHGVTSGNLDVAAIAADKDAVQAALAPAFTEGAHIENIPKTGYPRKNPRHRA